MDMHPPPRAPWLRPAYTLGLLALLVALAGPAPAAQAAPIDFQVTKTADTADGVCAIDCSLREAIIAANANPGADTVFLSSGTYTLSIAGAGEDQSAIGELGISESLTISTFSSSATVVTAGADWADRIFQIAPGASVTIKNLAISGGKPAGAIGGGIFNQGMLTLQDSLVSSNSAAGGGGIASAGTLNLQNSDVSGNSATAGTSGGGVLSSGALALDGATISGNSAGGLGGGISASGTATIAASTISANSAAGGGGGISGGTTLTIGESTISGNTAGGGGGGILNHGTLAIGESTISGNTAGGRGGGVLNQAVLALTNSTISGNTASSGGAIANAGSATLASATLARNTATGGSGGGVQSDPGTSFGLKNTLLAENTGAVAADCAGTLTSQGYNLVGKLAGACVLAGASGDLLNRDAQLAGLRDNGGATLTHALLPGSPALDAGSPATPGSGGGACPAADQRGLARPQTGRCDIGAYELPGVSIVDFAFQPAGLVVHTGTSVRWKNIGAATHSSKANNNDIDFWVSPALAPGDTFFHTFNSPGIFSYICAIHPNQMFASITVIGQPVQSAPLLTKLSPNTAVAGSPTLQMTLSGQRFDSAAIVEWNATTLQIVSFSPDQIIVSVPAALLVAAGSASVRVVNPLAAGGASNSLSFTITSAAAPVLRALTPASVTAGSLAFTLTLLGSGFAPGATVGWGGTSLTPATIAPGQITLQVPAALVASVGSAAVTVVNPLAAGGASNALTFTITKPGDNPVPTIISIAPSLAQVGSGALTLTISGSGFVAGATVQFGGTTLVPSLTSSGQIVVTIPAELLAAVGTFDVTVSNPDPGGSLSNVVPFRVAQLARVYLALARK